ncbi:NADH-quinone oxidoreductase subunit J [Bacillus sp. FJAT-27251]|uniref:NADH-quinone oxidoreductase subunit J n=1 Tax=Bacillus sp. FJAT-27251 TaxID=1684142 RepID=UPI0006A7C7DF|nr:NADH-quinone oxidoreductase subunit J [Bacillus sp. FJAT-27251]
MTLSGEFLAFMSLAIVAVVGGMLLLNLTKVVHMVLGLFFTFASIAGIFILLTAEFLAVVQILVYSGAITIIMLFGIMLTRHQDEEEQPAGGAWKRVLLLIGVLSFGSVFYIGIYGLDFGATPAALHVSNTEQIGMALYRDFVIPFELMSVLLLVALVGAIVLSRKDDGKEAEKQ